MRSVVGAVGAVIWNDGCGEYFEQTYLPPPPSLSSEFRPEDFVVAKLDIEFSEFPLIAHLRKSDVATQEWEEGGTEEDVD